MLLTTKDERTWVWQKLIPTDEIGISIGTKIQFTCKSPPAKLNWKMLNFLVGFSFFSLSICRILHNFISSFLLVFVCKFGIFISYFFLWLVFLRVVHRKYFMACIVMWAFWGCGGVKCFFSVYCEIFCKNLNYILLSSCKILQLGKTIKLESSFSSKNSKFVEKVGLKHKKGSTT